MTNAVGEVLLELATVTVVVYGPLHFSLMAGDIFCNKGSSFWFFRSALSHQNGFESTQYHTESNLEDVMMTMIMMMMVMMFWGTDVADDGHQSLEWVFRNRKHCCFCVCSLRVHVRMSAASGGKFCVNIFCFRDPPPPCFTLCGLYILPLSHKKPVLLKVQIQQRIIIRATYIVGNFGPVTLGNFLWLLFWCYMFVANLLAVVWHTERSYIILVLCQDSGGR